MIGPNWTRLVRFLAKEDGQIHLGEVNNVDVGLAFVNGEKITAKLINGSIYDGVVTEITMTVSVVRCLHHDESLTSLADILCESFFPQ